VSSLATRARKHQASQAAVALAGVRAVRSATKKASTAGDAKAAATTTLATYQLASALNGARAMAGEFGRGVLTAPLAYVGTTELGYSIGTSVSTVVDHIARDLDVEWRALTDDLLGQLDRMVFNEVVAAGTDAQSAEVFAEDALYVRVLVPPSCDRCANLAGRTYRSEEAFERHPQCNCEHWPVGTEEAARAAGLIVDPLEALEAGQVRGLSKADEQAIRDGADFSQVVNAKRAPRRGAPGITNAVSAEIFGRHVEATLSGTTSRSSWRRANPNLPIRLRPQSIYEHAKDRDDALRLLRLYGYLK
jgi:hypothetical protein